MMARPARRRRRPEPKTGGILWIVALTAVVVSLIGGWVLLGKREVARKVNEDTGCLSSNEVPEAALFLVDTTDRLSPENAKYVVDTISNLADKLPKYSKIIVVPFADDTTAPLVPIFSKCLPGRGVDAGFDQSARLVELAYADFRKSLGSLQDTLQELSDSKKSPISQQIVRAASNRNLLWSGNQRTLVLLSDGLESTIYWSKSLKLADPPPDLLSDVKVDYVELGNKKGGALQTDQMRQQWKGWFEKAGATVRMTAPGYPA